MAGLLGVSATLLGSISTHLQAEDYNAPGIFEVTPFVANPNPGGWTATEGGPVANNWVNASFEPFIWRKKWHAEGDAPNTIILNKNAVDGYSTYKEGLLDGADVRVHRIVDGELVLVREDQIAQGGYRASGWSSPNGIDSSKLVSPSVTSAQSYWDSWNRPDVPYYFTVVAVGTNGMETTSSEVLAITPGIREGNKGISNTLISFTPPANPTGTAPDAPTNLAYSLNGTNGHVTITWDPVTSPDLAGYRVQVSDYHPDNHHGYGIDLAGTASTSEEEIKTGDMIFVSLQKYELNKEETFANRIWSASTANTPTFMPFNLPSTGKSWELVPHPTPIPSAFTDGGETCLKVDMTGTGEEEIRIYNHSSTLQQFYKVLDPSKTYVVEVWLRQENMTTPTVEFELKGPYGAMPSIPFQATGQWQKFTGTFQVPYLYQTTGQTGLMQLAFSGPGTLYVDNFRVYEQGTPFNAFTAQMATALAESGMSHLRTHSTIKSGWSYSMEMLTNENGVMGYGGNQYHFGMRARTLADLFRAMDTAGVNPWLQIEMHMSEDEWLGFVEYLAAPYNPGVDTPASKPWAYKRYVQGRQAPWSDAFDSIYFELSNETWNGLFAPWTFSGVTMTDSVTDINYSGDAIYGLFQESVIATLRSSPYWTTALEEKFSFILGGWGSQISSPNGYGYRAAEMSPSSDFVTWADYNGGWDNGDAPAVANDEGYSRALAFVPRRGQGSVATRIRNAMVAEGKADFRLGTYEAGPGYSFPGDLDAAGEESESLVMKSLAAGTATIDAFLSKGYADFDIQNFFTLVPNRDYWSSHAPWQSGGQAYPTWKAMELYNHEGKGDFLITRTLSAPTWDLPFDSGNDPKAMAHVYTTQNGNRFNVFVVSRKLDGYPNSADDGFTPVTIKLPFTNPSSITLHRMVGDPRSHNLDSDDVGFETVTIPTSAFSQDFVVDDNTGADSRGLPPAATLLYVFEGATPPTLPSAPEPLVLLPIDGEVITVETGTEVAVFEVLFSEPVDGFTAEDIDFSGSTLDTTDLVVTVEEMLPHNGGVYKVSVTNFTDLGDLVMTIPAGIATARSDGGPNVAMPSGQENTITIANSQMEPGPGTTTVPVAADSWVNYEAWRDPANPDTNYGNDTLLQTGNSTGRSTYLRFNLVKIASRPVLSATLRVYVHQLLQSGNLPVYAIANDTWSEMEITANTQPTQGSQIATLNSSTAGWVEIDVTAYIEAQRTADGLASMKLGNGAWWKIISKESSSGNQPELLINYDGAVSTLTNTLDREYWTGISGSSISQLTGHANYPHNPTGSDTLDSFEAVNWADSAVTKDWGSNYGQRIRGYIVPETSGNYTFWIAGDDGCDLWLSTDSDPLNAVKIAYPSTWTSQYQYNKTSSQKSVPISLLAGEAYYVEVRHKENAGGDNLSIAWSTNASITPTSADIIPGTVLSAFSGGVPGADESAPAVAVQPQAGTVYAGQSYTFTGTAGGNPYPAIEWFKGSTSVGHGDSLVLNNVTGSTAGDYHFVATNSVSSDSSNPATLTVITNTGLPGLNSSTVGSASVSVSRQLSGDEFEQATNATGTGATSDNLKFDYQVITGDFTAYVNIQGLTGGASARAGLMLRQDTNSNGSPAADDAFVFLGTQGGSTSGYVQQYRGADAGTAPSEVATQQGSSPIADSLPNKWVMIERIGDDLNLYTSSDGVTYDQVDTNYTVTGLSANVLIGIATSSGSSETIAVSTFDDFTVVPASSGPSTLTNTVDREYWTGITGTNISNLTGHANYPNSPTGSDTLTQLEAADWSNPSVTLNWADNYGQRIRGYIVPETSGNYTFWIASDDSSQLWLSTDELPSNVAMIAYVNNYTSQYQYNKVSSQKSAPISLVAGQPYYVEILQKEGGGSDNVSVAWSTNSGITPTSSDIVPSSVLSAYSAGVPSPSNAIDFGSSSNFSGYEPGTQDAGTIVVSSDGGTNNVAKLVGNAWKSYGLTQTIDSATRVRFSLKVTGSPEIVGIALGDSGDTVIDDIIGQGIQLFGDTTQDTWFNTSAKNTSVASWYSGAGAYVQYDILVDDFAPLGSYTKLIFVGDDDAGTDSEVFFKDVEFY